MNRKLLVYGGGGHTKVLIGILQRTHHYEIVGYVDKLDKGQIFGVPYIGDDSVLDNYLNVIGVKNIVMGISYLENNPLSPLRHKMIDKLKNMGFYFPTIVSEHAMVNHPKSIGEGTVIFDGAIINADACIGDFCVINSGATIEHDTFLDENVQIAPQATLCGGVTVGVNTYIGANTVVINNIQITKNVLIGAGSVVIRDITEPGVYVGGPTRRIK